MPENPSSSTQKVTYPPAGEIDFCQQEFDPLEPNSPDFDRDFDQNFDDDFLDVFLPDDDPEPLPECGDFWIERD